MSAMAIACSLAGAARAARRDELAREIFQGCDRIEDLPDGYAFRFLDAEAVTPRLVEFISFERRCCPFLAFELAFEPQQGPLWLRLRGPDAVKQFIRAEIAPGALA